MYFSLMMFFSSFTSCLTAITFCSILFTDILFEIDKNKKNIQEFIEILLFFDLSLIKTHTMMMMITNQPINQQTKGLNNNNALKYSMNKEKGEKNTNILVGLVQSIYLSIYLSIYQ